MKIPRIGCLAMEGPAYLPKWKAPIATRVVKLKAFYPDEEHHPNFCNRNPKDRYVVEVAMPKVSKRKQLPKVLKK